jgi:polysaccharide export outer membrane protein
MRRLVPLLLVVFAASGCMHTAATNGAPGAAAPPDLDSLAYNRSAPAAYAQAQSQSQAQPSTATPAEPDQSPASGAQASGTQPKEPRSVVVPVVPVAAPSPRELTYFLDTGDKLRIVVFGQDGLSNSYFVDAAGQITMPLIGPVNARGLTTQQLARAVAAKLRNGFIREPHVAIEVEVYRPFFILGEVTYPGQYPYVPNMTVETAVAIAGGFTPRAYRFDVKIDRPETGGVLRARAAAPLLTRVQPGDTIVIKERWF